MLLLKLKKLDVNKDQLPKNDRVDELYDLLLNDCEYFENILTTCKLEINNFKTYVIDRALKYHLHKIKPLFSENTLKIGCYDNLFNHLTNKLFSAFVEHILNNKEHDVIIID